jgi:very-short-patch-repair endonuclease
MPQDPIRVRREGPKRVAVIAARQLRVVTGPQAIAAGMTRHMVAARLGSTTWERIHPGVFRIAGTPPSWNQKVMSAVLAAGEGAVASHQSAATLYRLDGIDRSRIEITVGGVAPLKLHRVVVHRSLVLEECDSALVDGIPTTSVARTLADCSGVLSLGQLARALDDGLVRRLVTLDAVREVATRLGPAPGRRITRLRLLVAERGVEADSSGSRPEMRLFRALRDAGLRDPVSQHAVRADGKQFFIDAAYPYERLALEYQGFDPHRTRSAFDSDARRTRTLTAAGWRVLSFTSKDSDADIVAAVRAFGV